MSAKPATSTPDPPPVPLQAGVYRHYKGGLYLLLGIAQHTETGERLVVYVSLQGTHLPGPRMRARPLSMFVDKLPGGQPRFEWFASEVSDLSLDRLSAAADRHRRKE